MGIGNIRSRYWIYLLPLVLVLLAACAILGQHKITRSQITFPHKSHAAAEVECEVCHQEIANSVHSLDNNLPEIEVCRECHEDEEPKIIYSKAVATILPMEYGMRFSHKIHLGEGLECTKCHKAVSESSLASDNNLPGMGVCSECHTTKPRECTVCHYTLGSDEYIPASHDKTLWVTWHENQAERNDDLCSDCHKGDVRLPLDQNIIPGPGHGLEEKTMECSNCHRGDIRPDRHSNSYILTHGIDAKVNSSRCNVCHRRAECRDCHEAVDFRTRIHPAGWINNGHVAPARNNLGTCIGCHDEQTCIVCHFEISPHPSDWKSRLSFGGARQHRDSSVCMKCHEREELCTKCHGLRDE
jgi:hypothetical protein